MPHIHDLEEDMIRDSEERLKEKRERRINNARWWAEYLNELPEAFTPFYYIIIAIAIILTVTFAALCVLFVIKFGIWLFT